MRRRLCAALVSVAIALSGCGDDAPTGADESSTTTTTSTAPATTTSSTTAPPIVADYGFAVSAAVEQLRPSGERVTNAVHPGQSLRLDFTNTSGPENPCPSEADIEVTDRTGVVVASATGFSVDLPDHDLDGPLRVTARCTRGDQTGIGTWEDVEALELLDLMLGVGQADAGDAVDIIVAGTCPDGSAATADLLFAQGAELGVRVALAADGTGALVIPDRLVPQTLYVRAECTGDPGAIAFAALDIGSQQAELVVGPIEYQPGVVLSLYLPTTCDGTRRPAMVTSTAGDALEWSERGYVGVAVLARNPGNTGALDTSMLQSIASATNDFAIAVQWLRANAEEFCIEPDAIAATGHSFWGITALSLAYSHGELVEGDVVTLAEFGGSATVGPPPPDPPPELAGFSDDIAAAVSFSGFAIADLIDAGEPPAILFHGRNDSTVPFVLAEQTCAAATAVGVTCELVPHDAGHSRAEDIDAAWDVIAEFLEREMLIPAGITVPG